MIKYTSILILALWIGTVVADREVVRLSEENEAWLVKDIDKALSLLLAQTDSANTDNITLYNIKYY